MTLNNFADIQFHKFDNATHYLFKHWT